MSVYYYNSECKNIHIMLGRQLSQLLAENNAYDKDIVIMCIGSDRSTGDSLGPIIGYHLLDTIIKNVVENVAKAVREAAINTGVARVESQLIEKNYK